MTQDSSQTLQDRAARLKATTAQTRESLDRRIMDAGIFSSHERYTGFLRVQARR